MRLAVKSAGRPGMVLINNAPSCLATIAMYSEEHGLRKTDGIESSGISEIKANYDDLNRSAFGLTSGIPIHGAHSSVIGGFSATPEGAAIAAVAGTLQLMAVHQSRHRPLRCGRIDGQKSGNPQRTLGGRYRNPGIKSQYPIDDRREASAAHPAAGPGTKQYFNESAAGHIVSTVTGGHSMGGTRKFIVGNTPDYGSPMESRWMGEVCKGATGMDKARPARRGASPYPCPWRLYRPRPSTATPGDSRNLECCRR